jgi:hypothetical protein
MDQELKEALADLRGTPAVRAITALISEQIQARERAVLSSSIDSPEDERILAMRMSELQGAKKVAAAVAAFFKTPGNVSHPK